MTGATLFELQDNLKRLTLSTMARELASHLRQAKESGTGHDEFLQQLQPPSLRPELKTGLRDG